MLWRCVYIIWVLYVIVVSVLWIFFLSFHSLNRVRLHSFVAHFIYFIIMSIVAVQSLSSTKWMCRNVVAKQIVANNYNGKKKIQINALTTHKQPASHYIISKTMGPKAQNNWKRNKIVLEKMSILLFYYSKKFLNWCYSSSIASSLVSCLLCVMFLWMFYFFKFFYSISNITHHNAGCVVD